MKGAIKAMRSVALVAVATVMMGCGKSGQQQGIDLTARLQSLQRAEAAYEKMDSAAREKAFEADADTLFRDLKAGVKSYADQGLCSQSDWAISLPQCKGNADALVAIAEDIYNGIYAHRAMWHDCEIWCRGFDMGGALVDSVSVVKSIGSLNADRISDEGLRKELLLCRDSTVWAIGHPEAWGEEGERNPGDYVARFVVAVYERYLQGDIEKSMDIQVQERLLQLDVDSTEVARYTNAWPGDSVWWKEMIEAKDIDRRCELALIALHANKGDQRWALEAMMAIMQANEYSPLLPRLWRTWRCACQQYYYGLSRDSIIPNNTFNRYRRMVYTTVINHLIKHPEDMLARHAAFYLLLVDDMVRNGDCIMGSDCLLERMEMGI